MLATRRDDVSQIYYNRSMTGIMALTFSSHTSAGRITGLVIHCDGKTARAKQ